MTHDMTTSDFGESITGFEEIAIAQRFGRTLTEMTLAADYTMSTRALIFAAKRREGATDDDAWNGSMEMPVKEVYKFFAEPAEDEDPAAGSVGKDEAPEPQRETSLISVS